MKGIQMQAGDKIKVKVGEVERTGIVSEILESGQVRVILNNGEGRVVEASELTLV